MFAKRLPNRNKIKAPNLISYLKILSEMELFYIYLALTIITYSRYVCIYNLLRLGFEYEYCIL